ncbi:hypothetical protein [Streptomyces fuscichromogenes]|uniref:Uncharacterized protein n=1 Tax=Streptomyces fuscichromogenes TaxID=1324013 RepID=A0A917XJD2_9ACTN|nr:hypothetical protein [Streptomyces fuscichromogenes]GGN32014.1 hypothetical protein GCM10011578_070390 [Streptomyces fuscichromogenes]
MRHVTDTAKAAGWQPDRLRLERFAPAGREPDHRDEVQTDEERAASTRIAICCSRSRSAELVLGL